jgi:hypothetical protein
MTRHKTQRKRWAISLLLALILAVPFDLLAKGFSGGGGSRMGGGRSSGGRSYSFSGSSGARRNLSTKPTYDSSAGRARQREISSEQFNLWRGTRNPSPKTFDPGLAQSRQQRMETTFGSRPPTGYYHETPNIVIYRDSYDNGFMKYVTMMWLFNHWNNVDRSRFDDARVRDLEEKFRDLEARGYRRDPNYTEPGIDPDLAYRRDQAYGGSSGLARFFWGMIIVAILLWLAWFVFVRRVPYAKKS